MKTFFRLTLIALTAATVILAVTGVSQPSRVASRAVLPGMRPISATEARVMYVATGSASQRAGLRVGDIVDITRKRLANFVFRRAGQQEELSVSRGGRRFQLRYHLDAQTARDPLDRSPAGFAVVIVGALAGLFVGLRGAARRDARVLSLFLLMSALGLTMAWQATIASTGAAAFIWQLLVNVTCYAYVNYALILLGTAFPAVPSRLRTALCRSAVPLAALFLVATVWEYAGYLNPAVPLSGVVFNYWALPAFCNLFIANIVVTSVCIAGCIAGLLHVDDEHRAQMHWMAAILIVTCVVWIVPTAVQMIDPLWNMPGTDWIVLLQDTPLLVLPYVILRHRLVDISVVVSRAAIFTTVSVVVVSTFILGEWGIGKLAENAVPGSDKSAVGQLLVLAIALAIGLSARTVHAQVDRRLNGVFFARRARAIANLHRFAEESDVVLKSSALLTLFHDTLSCNTDATYTAVYLRDGSTFVLNKASAGSLPNGIDEDDKCIVHMRRWQEPFESDRNGDMPFSEALFVPMMVRGSLVGFVVCGPKRERTHYAADEIEAVARAAQRATISYVLLSHPTITGTARLSVPT